MEKLRCSGCKASLRPQDKSVKFITCEYCRATIKNPKFREAPINVNHRQSINQEPRDHIRHPGDIGQSGDLRTFIPTLIPRRRFRRRRGGCSCGGCGCGCLVILILIIIIGVGLISFILEVGFDELIDMIERLIN